MLDFLSLDYLESLGTCLTSFIKFCTIKECLLLQYLIAEANTLSCYFKDQPIDYQILGFQILPNLACSQCNHILEG